jgi:hypothetical protein
MTKGEINMSNLDLDEPTITLNVSVPSNLKNVAITVYKNEMAIGSASSDQSLNTIVEIDDRDKFKFKYEGKSQIASQKIKLKYEAISGKYVDVVKIDEPSVVEPTVDATIYFIKKETDSEEKVVEVPIDVIGNIGTLKCYIE